MLSFAIKDFSRNFQNIFELITKIMGLDRRGPWCSNNNFKVLNLINPDFQYLKDYQKT